MILSPVGRLKINTRLNLDTDLETRTLMNQDIIKIVEYLLSKGWKWPN